MYIEFRHLKTIKAIHEYGGLARAADILCISQSALSHQVKALEDQVGMELFLRRSKPLKLSKAGHKLLELAEKILPQVLALEEDFAGFQESHLVCSRKRSCEDLRLRHRSDDVETPRDRQFHLVNRIRTHARLKEQPFHPENLPHISVRIDVTRSTDRHRTKQNSIDPKERVRFEMSHSRRVPHELKDHHYRRSCPIQQQPPLSCYHLI